MPVINAHVKRAPRTKIDGMKVLIQPYGLFPDVVRKSFDKKNAKGEAFEKYGYTLSTLKKGNLMERKYYGHNGHDWVIVGILTGSATSPRVRYEEA